MAAVTDIHPKVSASVIGAAVATIGCAVYTSISHDTVPNGVEGAITVVAAFILGWLAPERVSESEVVPVMQEIVADPPVEV